MQKEALIIFVKNPKLGKVKSRIAKTMGDDKALEIYHQLLTHTRSVTIALSQDVWVYYSDYISSNDLWKNAHFYKKVQSGSNLGDKMKNAFAECFAQGYERVSIIGSDLMDIDQQLIETAFERLRKDTEIVIGPAVDGGYYLLGMTQLYPFLFENKTWSTDKVLSDTLNDLSRYGLLHSLLEEKNDIDTQDDWEAISWQ